MKAISIHTLATVLALVFVIVFSISAYSEKEFDVKLKITIEDIILTATVLNNKTSREFISLLPLTLTLKDYAGTEKISDLPKRLSTESAPSGSDPSVGDTLIIRRVSTSA